MMYAVSLLLLAASASGLSILGVFPFEGKSHFFVFRVLMKELAERGHNVTVITYSPEKTPPKYHEVILTTDEVEEVVIGVRTSYTQLLMMGWMVSHMGYKNCETLLHNEQVRQLTNQKFDVILIEKFNTDCAHALAYKIGAPVVGITSGAPLPFHYSSLGIPYSLVYTPPLFLGGGTKPSLLQRINRVVINNYVKTIYSVIGYFNQRLVSRYLGSDIPSLDELARDTKFTLIYQNFALFGSRALPSNVIEVGGFHVEEPKPLPKALQEFMDGAEHGVVYISFGSVVKASAMPTEMKAAIMATVAALPQRFIWKWDGETIDLGKDKLLVGPWLPQADILAHPNTVAFVSHAGMLGTTEAIHYGVPIIAVPIFADQPSNAAAIEESGAGVELPLNDFTEERFIKALRKVFNPDFRARTQLVSRAFRDRPQRPIDTAVFWIEFAAKYPDLNTISPLAVVPWYSEGHWDLLLVALVVVGLVVVFGRKLVGSRGSRTQSKKSKTN